MSRSLLKINSFILSSLFMLACGEQKKDAVNPANMPVPVNMVKVNAERALYYDKFPGTVVALMQVDVRPVVSGYITGVFFREGEHVSKGQKLYAIDDSKFQAIYKQGAAGVSVAESNLAQAQKDADRYNYLNEHDAVAKQTLDHAMTTLQNAKNQLASAKQELAKAATDIEYSLIRSPFDGVIGISQVKLGNAVIAGQTVLNTISSVDPIAVDIVVNEKQIPRFVKLQAQSHPSTDSIFTLNLSDNSVYGHPGCIAFVDRGVNPQTGTIIVRLNFPNPATLLRAGMSCNVRVKSDDTSRQLLVPSKAIVEQMGEYFVFVARDTIIVTDTSKTAPATPSALHAIQKKVLLGQTIADKVVVRSGLQGGEDLITDGVQKLHDGSLIQAGAPQSKGGH